MSWLRDTLALYGDVFARGLALFGRNPILIVPVVVTVAARLLLWPLLTVFGILGGFIMVVVESMCWSAVLATTGDAIRTTRVDFQDVRAGFMSYVRDVINVRFVIFLVSLVLFMTPPSVLHYLIPFGMFVFFNAVPELIYLGRHGTTELLAESYRFMTENWIEWVPPNLVLAAVFLATLTELPRVVLPFLGDAGTNVLVLMASASVVAGGMVVRGLLFQELTGSSRRARAFRRRGV